MSTHKYIDRICCAVLALTLMLTFIFISAKGISPKSSSQTMGYEDRLFDTGSVHTLDIVMDDWEGFISTCKNEEYSPCSVVIDGESFGNVGLRAKGNTSLTQVESYGNNRYSFKLEFDRYESGQTYYGLDKLSLNNIIQDNTYMKDYITYQMMGAFGAVSPLCSYVYIRVNGGDWGLYLAVEGVEESFLKRNYGGDYGELYKPDSQSFGGKDMPGWGDSSGAQGMPDIPGMENLPDMGSPPDMGEKPDMGNIPEPPGGGAQPGQPENMPEKGGFGGFGGFGSDDVSLIYTDDDYSSYQNILSNAKTDITDRDKDRLIAALKKLNSREDLENTVDVENVIRYFVVHNFVCNFDSYTGSMIHNYYLYEDGGRLSMIPWDYNLAFGAFMGSQDATALVNYPIDAPVSGGTVESRPMLAWIFSDQEYTELYHRYFEEFITEYFESGEFIRELERVQSLIAPYVEKDPTGFCTYEEFQKGVSTLKDFCLLRAQSVSGQLDGSIPADSQAEDSEALIDGSEIDISAMGSMNSGFGGMGRQQDGRQAEGNQDGGGGDRAEFPGRQAPSENSGAPAGGPSGPFQETETGGPLDAGGLIMTLVCVLVLAAGIAAMLLYKKKA